MEEIISFFRDKVLNSEKVYTYHEFVKELDELITLEDPIKRIDSEVLGVCNELKSYIIQKKELVGNLDKSIREFNQASSFSSYSQSQIKKLTDSEKNVKDNSVKLILFFKDKWTPFFNSAKPQIQKLLDKDTEYFTEFIRYFNLVKESGVLGKASVVDYIISDNKKELSSLYNELSMVQGEDRKLVDWIKGLSYDSTSKSLNSLTKNELGFLTVVIKLKATVGISFNTSTMKDWLRLIGELRKIFDEQDKYITFILKREELKKQLVQNIINYLKEEKREFELTGVYDVVIRLPDLDVKTLIEEFELVLRNEGKYSERLLYESRIKEALFGKLVLANIHFSHNHFLIGSIQRAELTICSSDKSEVDSDRFKVDSDKLKVIFLRRFAMGHKILIKESLQDNDLYHLIAYTAMLNYSSNRSVWNDVLVGKLIPISKVSFKINYFLVAYRMLKIVYNPSIKDKSKSVVEEMGSAIKDQLSVVKV